MGLAVGGREILSYFMADSAFRNGAALIWFALFLVFGCFFYFHGGVRAKLPSPPGKKTLAEKFFDWWRSH